MKIPGRTTTPPAQTPEQRVAALNLANDYRHARRQLAEALTSRRIDVEAVLTVGHRGTGDTIVGRMQIGRVLNALPLWGPITTTRLLEQLKLYRDRHLDTLSADHVAAIVQAVTDRQTKHDARGRDH